MPDPEKKPLAAALAEVTEDDLADATAADEGAESEGGAEGDETPEPAKKEDDDADDETDETPEVEAADDDDDEEEAGAEDDVDGTPFDSLTPEQLKAIKSDPNTLALFKSVMKAYTTGTQNASQALKLVKAFQQNPDAVMAQLAQARGGEYKPPTPKEKKEAADDPDARLAEAVKELEGLFGEKLGPRVRGVFEKWFEARIAPIVSPLKSSLGRVISQGEQAKMLSEEHSYKQRYGDVLTPEVEDAVVKLGESGEIVPGPESTPSQYLDLLTEIVLSRQGKKKTKSERREAQEAIARRIKKNADDREPAGSSGRAPIKSASKVKPTMTLSEAFDAANAELDEEGA